MSSGDEFDKLMSSLSEDFGSEIVKDFEGLDKLQARVPKPITTLSHYTASIFKLTHTDELTTGLNGGSAMVDYMGNVVAFQVAKRPHEHEEECDPLLTRGSFVGICRLFLRGMTVSLLVCKACIVLGVCQ